MLVADLRDRKFEADPRAVYVVGPYGVPYMDQFNGVGPSRAPYRMKAMLVDGVVYIPERHIGRLSDYSSVKMVRAQYQPPKRAVKRQDIRS